MSLCGAKLHVLQCYWLAGLPPGRPSNLLRPMTEETYGEDRARRLEALLRALALRIQELDKAGKLLGDPGEMLRLLGDIRSELFTYEVRATFDTPEIAEHRRIVSESQSETVEWQKTEWTPEEDDPDK
jgi:hypothetical protein